MTTYNEVVARALWVEPQEHVAEQPVLAGPDGPVLRVDEQRELTWKAARIPDEARERLAAAVRHFQGSRVHVSANGTALCLHCRFARPVSDAAGAQRGCVVMLREFLCLAAGPDGWPAPGRWKIATRAAVQVCDAPIGDELAASEATYNPEALERLTPDELARHPRRAKP